MRRVIWEEGFKRAVKRACSVEYDCRIIFRFQALEGEIEEAIQLIDMGNHDEMY